MALTMLTTATPIVALTTPMMLTTATPTVALTTVMVMVPTNPGGRRLSMAWAGCSVRIPTIPPSPSTVLWKAANGGFGPWSSPSPC